MNKIKNPDQLIFISVEIGNLLKQRELINNEQLIVEPTMEKLIHPLNEKYNENEVLSISDFNTMEHPEYFAEYAPKEEVKQVKKADSYTNEILDKIRAAGIEVITDKDKYSKTLNRIIEINVILEMLEDNPLKIEKGRSQLNADSIPNLKNIIDIRNNQEYYVNKIELLKHSCITFRFRKAS